jgi:hypothetical protein
MSHIISRILGFCEPAQTPAPAVTNIIPLPAAPMATKYLPYKPEGIPQTLRDHPHWLVADCTGRPVARRGVGNSKTNPDHWTDFATASRIAESETELWPYIVLTDDSLFTVFDPDFKPRRETETPEQYEVRIERAGNALEHLRETVPVRYESRSKSGNGFHIIVLGKFDGSGGKGKDEWADVEIYTRGHGLALTGHVFNGHDDPAPYFPETIQAIRDTIKGATSAPGSGENMPDRKSNGSVRPEWARQVLAELARLHGRPERGDWRDMSSAVFDGVGVDLGIELLEEVWPEEEAGEYRTLARTLKPIPWGTLNGFLRESEMRAEKLVDFMPDLSDENSTGNAPEVEPFAIIRAGLSAGMSMAADFVEGLLTDAGASVVYGPSNCGKSFWILDLAVAVATGKPFRGKLEVDQGAVIYVALEGSHGVKNRIEVLKRASRLKDDAPLFLCFAPVSLLNPEHAGKLAASVKLATEQSGLRCRLVILDTMARAMAGGDENSGKDMTFAVASIDAIRAATGAHVCVVHHCGKDEARGARGHSSLRAAVDTEIEVSRPEGETISTVRVTKQRDLPMSAAMPFSLVPVTLGTDRRRKPVTSCLVRHEDEEKASKPKKAGRKAKCTANEMLQYLPAATVAEWQERVHEETGLGETQFYEHKKTLETAGRIRREPGTGDIIQADSIDAMPDLSEEF